ncbi:MAG: hypothetical protein ACTS78_00365 [Arsenophonus sp. NC-WZS1-MAG3]
MKKEGGAIDNEVASKSPSRYAYSAGEIGINTQEQVPSPTETICLQLNV